MKSDKLFRIYLLVLLLSIILALFTANVVHSSIRRFELSPTVWIVCGLVVIGTKYFIRLAVYVRRLYTVMKIIRKYKL